MELRISKAAPRCIRTSKREDKLKAFHVTYNIAGVPIRVWSMFEPNQQHEELSKQVLHSIAEIFPHTTEEPQAEYVLVSRKVKENCSKVDVGKHEFHPVNVSEQKGVVQMGSRMLEPQQAVQEKLLLTKPVVFSRLSTIQVKEPGQTKKRLQPDYYTIYGRLLQMAAVRGRTLVHGAAIAVETPRGPMGVLFVGGQGVGKTETAMHAINVGAKHIEDDVVNLTVRKGMPHIGGSNYRALLRFKNQITPQMREHPERFFLEYEKHGKPENWNHLPIRKLREAGAINRNFNDVSEIYQEQPVPLDTIVFLVPSVTDPWQQELHSMKIKPNTDLKKLVELMAKKQWNEMNPAERKKEMEKFFESTGRISIEKDGHSLESATRIGGEQAKNARELVIRWLEHSAENDYHADPRGVRGIIEKTPNVLIIGKWVPPEKDQAFAQMIRRFVEKSSEKNH